MAKEYQIGAYSAYAIAVKYGYKGTEEEWARLQVDSGNNAQTAAVSAEEAAESAEQAAIDADRAEQAAAISGYMDFHIDEAGHLQMVRTDNMDVTFAIEDGRLIINEED